MGPPKRNELCSSIGLGWEDVCVKYGITDPARKDDIRRTILKLNAGGRIGATVRADGSGPNRESGR